MQIDHSFIVDDPRLPDMKATYSRHIVVVTEVYFGQLWGGVHLLAPPRKKNSGNEIVTLTFAAETLTLAFDFISCVGCVLTVFTLYPTSISIVISTAGTV